MARYPLLGLTKVFLAAGMTAADGAAALGIDDRRLRGIAAGRVACSPEFVAEVSRLTGVPEKVVRAQVIVHHGRVKEFKVGEVHLSSAVSFKVQNKARGDLGLPLLGYAEWNP